MKNFRTDNTEGFTTEQLSEMNIDFEKRISDYDSENENYDNDVKRISEQILNKY